MDYQAFSEITFKDAYYSPLLQDIFDKLSGSNILFWTLDLRSGYWQFLANKDS